MISFNEPLASILQQVAVFLEAGGFFLVLIDIYRPGAAQSIEDALDTLGSDPLEVGDYLWGAMPPIVVVAMGVLAVNSPRVFFVVSLAVFLVLVLTFFLWSLHNELYEWKRISSAVALALFSILFFIGAALFGLPRFVMRGLSRSTGGHMFAGLGLVLAFFGLCCEVYQVITLCRIDGCYQFLL